jgi:hypothetical protein
LFKLTSKAASWHGWDVHQLIALKQMVIVSPVNNGPVIL